VNKNCSTHRSVLSINTPVTRQMRVLLYDVESSRYYQSPAGWTSDPGLAFDLQGTVQAVNLAFQNRLRTAEIVLAFDEKHLKNMHLPLCNLESRNGNSSPAS